MHVIYVFLTISGFALLYLITEILKVLHNINTEIPNTVIRLEKEMKKFHSAHYDNLIDQIPNRAFIKGLLQEKEDITSKIQALTAESKEKRYQRLSEAFSPSKPSKELNNVESRSSKNIS